MITKIVHVLMWFFISFRIFSQVEYKVLDQNDVLSLFSNTGTQLHNYDNSTSGYTIPKVNGFEQFYRMQFWYAGKDINDQIHACLGGNQYGSDVFSGPIQIGGTPTSSWIFDINQETIDQYHQYWLCTNQLNGLDCDSISMPTSNTMMVVDNWPDKFPFFDFNGDGLYDVNSGDYPIIKGCKAIFLIQNDLADVHMHSGMPPLGIETYYLFYQYNGSGFLNTTTFIDVCTINKSTSIYHDFAQAVWFDYGLNYQLPYFGCDTLRNMAYTYYPSNQTNLYPQNPPAVGVVSISPSVKTIQPFNLFGTVNAQWNLMHGFKTDGSKWISPSMDTTEFPFYGNPNDTNSWSLSNPVLNYDFDKFLVSSVSDNFEPNESIFKQYAIVYSRSGNNWENLNHLFEIGDSVIAFNQVSSSNSCDGNWLNTSDFTNEELKFFPNPTMNELYFGGDAVNSTYEVYNSFGVCVLKGELEGRIQLDQLESGSYVIHVDFGDKIVPYRFIKL